MHLYLCYFLNLMRKNYSDFSPKFSQKYFCFLFLISKELKKKTFIIEVCCKTFFKTSLKSLTRNTFIRLQCSCLKTTHRLRKSGSDICIYLHGTKTDEKSM